MVFLDGFPLVLGLLYSTLRVSPANQAPTKLIAFFGVLACCIASPWLLFLYVNMQQIDTYGLSYVHHAPCLLRYIDNNKSKLYCRLFFNVVALFYPVHKFSLGYSIIIISPSRVTISRNPCIWLEHYLPKTS